MSGDASPGAAAAAAEPRGPTYLGELLPAPPLLLSRREASEDRFESTKKPSQGTECSAVSGILQELSRETAMTFAGPL